MGLPHQISRFKILSPEKNDQEIQVRGGGHSAPAEPPMSERKPWHGNTTLMITNA